jgi:hypothetical protein
VKDTLVRPHGEISSYSQNLTRETGLRDLWRARGHLWKLEEIVIFSLNSRGDGPRSRKNNSLVIHILITPGRALRLASGVGRGPDAARYGFGLIQ